MNKRMKLRLVVTICVTLLCVCLFAGFPPRFENVKARIHRGLDLQGGIQLILQVVTDDAIRAETDQAVENARGILRDRKIAFERVFRKDAGSFSVVAFNPVSVPEIRDSMATAFPEWTINSRQSECILSLKPDRISVLRDHAVDQVMQIIQKRVDGTGVVEPVIQKHGGTGSYQILVQLPGEYDTSRMKELLQKTAVLEFKLVDSGPFPSREAAVMNYGTEISEGLEILSSTEASNGAYYAVRQSASVHGLDLRSAGNARDENGRPAVSFTLSSGGSQKLSHVTEDNIGKRLAIVLDGKIQSAPIIETRISDSGIIKGGAGGFAPKQAQDLATILRAGALPASILYLDEEFVGPTLGADSIHAGVLAAGAATLVVMAFMLFYYRISGVNAAIAMLLNILILLAAIAYFGITLTLPGIAGITLTVGMGTDSNVLIFERIREELRAGKTAFASVKTGFSRVFVTLIDTHLTASISALFLFLFGTGPIKGFAVTLVIGLIANMFTAVFVSRTLFEWLLSRRAGSSLSI